jgi:hypothetical protein
MGDEELCSLGVRSSPAEARLLPQSGASSARRVRIFIAAWAERAGCTALRPLRCERVNLVQCLTMR